MLLVYLQLSSNNQSFSYKKLLIWSQKHVSKPHNASRISQKYHFWKSKLFFIFSGFGQPRGRSSSQDGSSPSQLPREPEAEEGSYSKLGSVAQQSGRSGRQVRRWKHQALAGRWGRGQIRTVEFSSQSKISLIHWAPFNVIIKCDVMRSN